MELTDDEILDFSDAAHLSAVSIVATTSQNGRNDRFELNFAWCFDSNFLFTC